MRRIIPISIALALAGTTLVSGAASNASQLAAKKPVETDFGMTATSYGTRVIGGAVPVDSSQTASQSLSCTNKAGINKRNHIAEVTLDGLGVLQGVTSRTWTTKVGNTVSSYASHDVAHLNLFNSSLGSLDINGLHSQARAWHDSKGFHSSIESKIASITFTPTGGEPMGLDIPTIGKPILLPGHPPALHRRRSHPEQRPRCRGGDQRARHPSASPAAARTRSRRSSARPRPPSVTASRAACSTAAPSAPRQPCSATWSRSVRPRCSSCPARAPKGKPVSKEVASVNIPPLLEVGAAHAGVLGASNNKKSTATAAAYVAKVDIGDGALVINGIKGVATVTRVGGKLTRSSEGTVVLEVLVDG